MGKMTKNNNGNNCLEIWKVSKMIKTTYNKNSRRMIKKQKSMKSISPNLKIPENILIGLNAQDLPQMK